jgi:hypothetical protein
MEGMLEATAGRPARCEQPEILVTGCLQPGGNGIIQGNLPRLETPGDPGPDARRFEAAAGGPKASIAPNGGRRTVRLQGDAQGRIGSPPYPMGFAQARRAQWWVAYPWRRFGPGRKTSIAGMPLLDHSRQEGSARGRADVLGPRGSSPANGERPKGRSGEAEPRRSLGRGSGSRAMWKLWCRAPAPG